MWRDQYEILKNTGQDTILNEAVRVNKILILHPVLAISIATLQKQQYYIHTTFHDHALFHIFIVTTYDQKSDT